MDVVDLSLGNRTKVLAAEHLEVPELERGAYFRHFISTISGSFDAEKRTIHHQYLLEPQKQQASKSRPYTLQNREQLSELRDLLGRLR